MQELCFITLRVLYTVQRKDIIHSFVTIALLCNYFNHCMNENIYFQIGL